MAAPRRVGNCGQYQTATTSRCPYCPFLQNHWFGLVTLSVGPGEAPPGKVEPVTHSHPETLLGVLPGTSQASCQQPPWLGTTLRS